MALANLGESFFKKGLRVIAIDWDLEAPGLESYFYSPAEGQAEQLARVAAHPGLIDMLREYREEFPKLARQRSSAPDAAEGPDEPEEVELIPRKVQPHHRSRIPKRLRRADVPLSDGPAKPATFAEILDRGLPSLDRYLQPIETSGSARLSLLTAGARSPEGFAKYADAVQDFDWLEFLAAYEGRAYLEWVRGKLSELADVVLIDSRTGVTEMGGVCTRQMADAVVAFCAPNNQSIEGVAKIVNSFDTAAAKIARYDRDLQVVVIPTRIDDSESGLLREFSDNFAGKFEIGKLPPGAFKDLERPQWNLQVPYIPKYNFREQRVIRPEPPDPAHVKHRPDPPTEKLIKAYEKIAVHLAVLAPADGPVRQAFQSEIATLFPHLLPRTTPRMAPPLPGNWVERPQAAASLQEALLLCAKAPNGGRLAIWGQAGMGKTSLLARVCQDRAIIDAFPDGIIWLTLDGAWGPERVQDFLRASFALPRSGGQAALAHALEQKRFLFVVDDVWTPDQLDAVFAFGKRDSRVIVTRDLGMASRFAASVVTVGQLTPEESGELLKSPTEIAAEVRADATLNWLLDWALGASLLRGAVERYSAQSGKPELAWNGIRAQLQRSGIKLLDQPESAGRNGSVSLSLRETLGRLQPDERKLLMSVARAGDKGFPCDPASGRRLADLGLVRIDGETLRADEILYRWLFGQGELTEDTEARRQRERKETLESGYAILRGRAAPLSDMEKIAYQAKDVRAFSLARKLLALARQHPDVAALPPARQLKLLQQHALCTYKDEDMVADERLTEAFQILNSGDLLAPTPSQETLGLAGAIYKLRWRYTGQRRDLEHSLGYYSRGAEGDLAGDFGYTRVNAAFVLDLLAGQEQQDSPAKAQARRQQAAGLREEIASRLPDLASQKPNAWLKGEWWYGATMAEALFGLSRYPEARYWLREALALDPPAWQLETTTRQMAALAQAQGVNTGEDSDAWHTIAMLVGDAADAHRAITAGKAGLALSGGGFRASLFHIGVLARLAELDVLRHVEVLSCVSGGSIIGAHYYLEVRRLLQEKRDREITREDYVEIVKRIEREFLAGVQKNLRNRLFAGWLANLRSIFAPGYSRTIYLGQLLEEHIYSRVPDGGGGKRFLNELQIAPKDGSKDFNPKLDNWRRSAKAPILLLNATTLNTGHVWQFAVNWMGEPPISLSSSVDSNDLLRRMYYTEAPVRHRRVRLGQAVAASACVPGLFDPIELDGLFPRRSVRLVDGGVHDNQGVAGLLEQECSVLLVSDASGQMNSERVPSGELVPVFKRTQDISMGRIREAEFKELAFLRRSSALGGLMFLHLKKDLEIKHVDWLDCQDPYDSSANPGKTRRGATLTTYGIPKNVQGLLAGLRTDLDAFSDAEAYALMLSGYRMASADFAASPPPFPVSETSRESWSFLAIAPTVDRATDYEPENDRLQDILAVGAKLPLKVWRLRPLASTFALLGTVAPLFLAGIAIRWGWREAKPWVEALQPGIEIAVAAIASVCVLFLLAQRWRGRKSFTVIGTGILMVTVGWIVARIHLWFFDGLFRGAGAVRRREGPEREQSQGSSVA